MPKLDSWIRVLVASFATGTGVVTTTGGVTVTSVIGENRTAAKRYLQLFNQDAALSGGEVPTVSIPFAAETAMVLDDLFGVDGVVFGTGLVYGWSTTAGTYTAATAADHDTQIFGG